MGHIGHFNFFCSRGPQSTDSADCARTRHVHQFDRLISQARLNFGPLTLSGYTQLIPETKKCWLNRISAIAPPKKRTKNDARGSARVENPREIGPGIELAAKHEPTFERVGYYLNSNRRRIVSDPSLFRYVIRLLADISADSTNPVKSKLKFCLIKYPSHIMAPTLVG